MISVLTTSNWKRPALVLVSLLLSLWHFGPLQATLPALFLTVGIQVYLLGYLAARALGLWQKSETIVIRVTWLAACGLGISIVLGALFRLLLVPMTVYVIVFHILMLALCFVPATSKPIKPISRQSLPFYLLLAFIAVLFVLIGWDRNKLRFSNYPDQTYPMSLSDWWARNPQPEAINSRNITENTTVTYWSTDGLTYVFAAWQWASGATAVQLIWYVLTPLFAWLVPLAHFALVYRVTRRADTAAWATGIVFIFALTTINTPSLLGGAWMYGQEAAFQLSTLRTFSAALLLPLTLFVFFSSLRRPSLRSHLITGIVVLALALTHPRQYLVMLTGLYAILGLRWMMRPSKRRFLRLLPLALVILPSLMVPFLQYSDHLQTQITSDIVSDLPGAVSISQQVIEPAMLLFHPFVVLTLAFSVFAIIRLRRSLSAQYIVATVVVMLVLSYVTPIYNLILLVMNSYFGLHFVFELFFMLPIGLVLGLAITTAYDGLVQRTHLHRAVTSGFITALFVVVPLIMLIEPFPIPTSARDQLNAANQMQTIKDIRPFDEHLLTRLSST